ncbi:MAG: helix-turn-helix domain-containing protein [Tagaea sp.]
MNRLSKAIAADRERMNLSQAGLAKLLGIRQQAVSKWERGLDVPSRDKVAPLVAVLGRKSETAQVLADLGSLASLTRQTKPDVSLPRDEVLALLAEMTDAADRIGRSAAQIARLLNRIS